LLLHPSLKPLKLIRCRSVVNASIVGVMIVVFRLASKCDVYKLPRTGLCRTRKEKENTCRYQKRDEIVFADAYRVFAGYRAVVTSSFPLIDLTQKLIARGFC
jgi:hypothetical protein